MKKIKEFLLSQNFVLITFILLGIRAMVIEPGIGFALTSMAFAGIVAFRAYLDNKAKPDISAEIKSELETLRTHVSGIMMKHAAKPAQMNQEIKRFF